jgi:hypothetical protein
MEAGVEAEYAIRRQSEAGHEWDIPVTQRACLADVPGVRGRGGIRRPLDAVFAMAAAAGRRFAVARRDGLPMDALLELLALAAVTHGAGLNRDAAERRATRTRDLVRRAVTDSAIGGCFVAGEPFLTMDPKGRLIGNCRMAYGTIHRFGVCRMGVGFVVQMAARAFDSGMGRGSECRRLLMAIATLLRPRGQSGPQQPQ